MAIERSGVISSALSVNTLKLYATLLVAAVYRKYGVKMPRADKDDARNYIKNILAKDYGLSDEALSRYD
ncbi:hypothetical protein BJ878DRAFT_542004 [Calycina marina]|uniref:Uncharacterized protein n=1 Tax=Calycina marina TaxID=1763456 RepID=A0A9P7Z3P2_9HELO|nr:hypothetical protein BJ878DRAFT_542004 [Calycina marina]